MTGDTHYNDGCQLREFTITTNNRYQILTTEALVSSQYEKHHKETRHSKKKNQVVQESSGKNGP